MPGSMTISGLDRLQKRLAGTRERLPGAISRATDEAVYLVQTAAQRILDEEIYDKPRPELAKPLDKWDEDSLYASFRIALTEMGDAVAQGKLTNISPHADFLENGTDDEGTGEHFVPVASGNALCWFSPETGNIVFDKGHMVHGIHPIRFMHRAWNENRAAIVALFRKELDGLFDDKATSGSTGSGAGSGGSGGRLWGTLSLPDE